MGIIDKLKKMIGVSDKRKTSLSEVDYLLNQEIITEVSVSDGNDIFINEKNTEMRIKILDLRNQIIGLYKLGMNSIENVPSQILGNSAIKIAILKAKEGSNEKASLEKLQDMNLSFDVSGRVAEINVQLLTMKPDSIKILALQNELDHLNSKGNVGAVYWLFKDIYGLESALIKQKIKDKIMNGWLDKIFLNFEESYNTAKAFEELIFIKDVDSMELICARLKTSKIEERLKQIEKEFDGELGTLYDSYSYELLNMMYNAVQINLNSIINSIDTNKLLNEMIKVHYTFFKNSSN